MPSKTLKGASAPAAVTKTTPFFSYNGDQKRLFAVCADIPAADALEEASNFLASAHQVAYAAEDGPGYWTAAVLIEMGKGLVDSIILPDAALIAEERKASALLVEALADLLSQVESGTAPEIYAGRAIAALSAWNAVQGGAA